MPAITVTSLGVSTRLLKETADALSPLLAVIFNESLQQGQVPKDWHCANVTSAYKK